MLCAVYDVLTVYSGLTVEPSYWDPEVDLGKLCMFNDQLFKALRRRTREETTASFKAECCKVKVSAVKMAQKGLQTSPVGFKVFGVRTRNCWPPGTVSPQQRLRENFGGWLFGAAAHAFGFHGRSSASKPLYISFFGNIMDKRVTFFWT